MLKKFININNKYGIHARPSSKISEMVSHYCSHVIIKYNDKEADASSIMSLILLCIEPQTQIELVVDGADEEEVFSKLVDYLEQELMVEELD